MHDEISWQVEPTIEPQHFDSFCALTNEMIQSTTLEDGVLVYERFMSEDGAKIFVYERYTNSEAALSHLRNYRKDSRKHSGAW
jgi:quinol monooxygenase YgiN